MRTTFLQNTSRRLPLHFGHLHELIICQRKLVKRRNKNQSSDVRKYLFAKNNVVFMLVVLYPECTRSKIYQYDSKWVEADTDNKFFKKEHMTFTRSDYRTYCVKKIRIRSYSGPMSNPMSLIFMGNEFSVRPDYFENICVSSNLVSEKVLPLSQINCFHPKNRKKV